jgi:hypothetical protein
LYDGNRITEDETPASLDMEDNGNVLSFSLAFGQLVDFHSDTIDVMVERMSIPSMPNYCLLTGVDVFDRGWRVD